MARQRDISVAYPNDFQTVGGVGMAQGKGNVSRSEDEEPDTRARKMADRPKMTKMGRAAARRNIRNTYAIASGQPKVMPSSKQRMRKGMNPTINNPNDIGAKIIPVGTPSTL